MSNTRGHRRSAPDLCINLRGVNWAFVSSLASPHSGRSCSRAIVRGRENSDQPRCVLLMLLRHALAQRAEENETARRLPSKAYSRSMRRSYLLCTGPGLSSRILIPGAQCPLPWRRTERTTAARLGLLRADTATATRRFPVLPAIWYRQQPCFMIIRGIHGSSALASTVPPISNTHTYTHSRLGNSWDTRELCVTSEGKYRS